MTTATATGADFYEPEVTTHDASGSHGWSVKILEGPVTSYSLTPEQTDTSGPVTLTEEIDRRRDGAPSTTVI